MSLDPTNPGERKMAIALLRQLRVLYRGTAAKKRDSNHKAYFTRMIDAIEAGLIALGDPPDKWDE